MHGQKTHQYFLAATAKFSHSASSMKGEGELRDDILKETVRGDKLERSRPSGISLIALNCVRSSQIIPLI